MKKNYVVSGTFRDISEIRIVRTVIARNELFAKLKFRWAFREFKFRCIQCTNAFDNARNIIPPL